MADVQATPGGEPLQEQSFLPRLTTLLENLDEETSRQLNDFLRSDLLNRYPLEPADESSPARMLQQRIFHLMTDNTAPPVPAHRHRPAIHQHDNPPPSEPAPSCRICYDETNPSNLLKLPCYRSQNCYYCSPCLTKLFELALKDEAHYPPKCHRRQISLNTARRYLPKSLIRQYQIKSLELSTKNKVYCSKVSCNAFVAPHSIHNGLAHCQECHTRTCVQCKEGEHFGPCDEGAGILVLQRLAESQKWQTCPDCRKIVEKVDGCPHILCRCRCDFCYECGSHLDTCTCVGDEEDEEAEFAEGEDYRPAVPEIVRRPRPRTPVFRELEEDIIADTIFISQSIDWEDS